MEEARRRRVSNLLYFFFYDMRGVGIVANIHLAADDMRMMITGGRRGHMREGLGVFYRLMTEQSAQWQ